MGERMTPLATGEGPSRLQALQESLFTPAQTGNSDLQIGTPEESAARMKAEREAQRQADIAMARDEWEAGGFSGPSPLQQGMYDRGTPTQPDRQTIVQFLAELLGMPTGDQTAQR